MNINPFDIVGRVIIVTGYRGLLGTQYVAALNAAQAIVIGWDADDAPADESSLCALCMRVDITEEAEVATAVAEVLERFGRIDGLVNNAAMNPAVGDARADRQFAPYTEYPIDLFRREIEVNLIGPMITTKHVARVMKERRSGSIVNIASEVSIIAHDHRVYAAKDRYKSPAYTASKTGILGLTRQWAAFLGEFNVRVNSLSIGGVEKEGIPKDFVERFGKTNMLGRMARPDEYTPTIIFLLSDASSFMTGSNLIADGGKSAW